MIVAEFDVRFTTISSFGFQFIFESSPDDDDAALLRTKNDASLTLQSNENMSWTDYPSATFSIDTWYHFKVICDETTKTTDIEIDTVPRVSGSGWSQPANFTAGEHIERFTFKSEAATYYVDNVVVYNQ